MWLHFRIATVPHKMVLLLVTQHSTILYRKSMKFGIQEELLLNFLDTDFLHKTGKLNCKCWIKLFCWNECLLFENEVTICLIHVHVYKMFWGSEQLQTLQDFQKGFKNSLVPKLLKGEASTGSKGFNVTSLVPKVMVLKLIKFHWFLTYKDGFNILLKGLMISLHQLTTPASTRIYFGSWYPFFRWWNIRMKIFCKPVFQIICKWIRGIK